MDIASRFQALRSQTSAAGVQATAAPSNAPSGRTLPHSNQTAPLIQPARPVIYPNGNGDNAMETMPNQDLPDGIDTAISDAQCALNKLRSQDPQRAAELFKRQPEYTMLLNATVQRCAPAFQDRCDEQDLQARVAQLEDMNRHFWHLAHDRITKDQNQAITAASLSIHSPSHTDHETQMQDLKKACATATRHMISEIKDALRCLKSDAGIYTNSGVKHSSRFKLPIQRSAEIDRLARLIDQASVEVMEALAAGLRSLSRTNEHLDEVVKMKDWDGQSEESESSQEALRPCVTDSCRDSGQIGIYKQKAMEPQNVVHELLYKLEDIKKKMQEEVTARKKAERALEQMGDISA